MKKKLLSLIMCTTLISALCLTGCGSSDSGSAASTDTAATASATEATATEPSSVAANDTTEDGEVTFTVGFTAEPRSFDPKYQGSAMTLTMYDCYDTLLNFSMDGKEVLPGLAESWEQVDDTTYTYHIRQGVKFSDGTDMTMEDVLFSMERVTKENYAMSYLFDYVDYWEITGDWDITVHLTQPDSTWKYVLCTLDGIVLNKAAVEAAGENYGTIDGPVLGTGPYVRDSWVSGTELTFSKNPYWWGDPESLDVDKIKFLIFSDPNTLALAVQAGQVDYARGLREDEMSIYESCSDYSIVTYQGTSAQFLEFNTQKAPFDDVNARKAVAYCIDKNAITELIGGRFATVSKAVIFPESMFYMDEDAWTEFNDSAESYQQDYEKAAEALAASKYSDGFEFDYWYSSTGTNQAEMIQAMIQASGLPITMNLHEYPSSEANSISYGYASSLDENGLRPYNCFATGWLSDYLDPMGYLKNHFHSTQNFEGGANKAAWVNKDYDALIDKTYEETDDTVRAQYMIDAYKIVVDECPYVSLYQRLDSYIINNRFDYEEGPAFYWNYSVANVHLKK